MTVIAHVKEYSNIPEGQPFPSSALRHLAATENIRQIVNRLVKAGDLKRVARGVFTKPKHISKVGEILPSASEVAETLANRPEKQSLSMAPKRQIMYYMLCM
jgi:hypothetical protein